MQKTTLNETAYEKIKEKIMKGDFSEENYTSQNQLVEELQMSRTPIVAALQRLQQEGFIKVIPNLGIIIQEPSLDEINDFYDMRLAIETYSLKHLANFSIDDFEILDDIINEQRKCDDTKDYFEFGRLDSDFHQYLLRVGGNGLFLQTMSNIKERMFLKTTRNLQKGRRMQQSIEEHIKIVVALKKGELNLALHELTEHLQNGQLQNVVRGNK